MFFSREQKESNPINIKKTYRSNLDNHFMIQAGQSILFILGSSRERAIYLETFENEQVKIVKKSIKCNMNVIHSGSSLASDSVSQWKLTEYQDINSASRDFNQIKEDEDFYYAIANDGADKSITFMKLLDDDITLICEIDYDIKNAYKKVFNEDLQIDYAPKKRGCSIM